MTFKIWSNALKMKTFVMQFGVTALSRTHTRRRATRPTSPCAWVFGWGQRAGAALGLVEFELGVAAIEGVDDWRRDVDFIARLQGGEFMLIFPETSKENGALVVDRIRQKIGQTSFSDVVGGASEIRLTICFGVAGRA